MVKTINSKSTKAEIMTAFEELKKEKIALENEVKRLSSSRPVISSTVTTPAPVVVSTPPISKPETSIKSLENNIMNTLQLDMDQTIKSLEKLQVNFGSAVSKLSEQLIAEATKLEDLQKALAQEREQLVTLHDLEEIKENTLDNLLESYQENAKNFEVELEEKKETLEQQIQDLEKQWQKEQENYHQELKERNENYLQTKQRNYDEYTYNLELTRNLAQEEYEQKQKELYDQLEEIRSLQEKQWQEKEDSLSKLEKEYQEVKQKVESFDQELKDNIEKGKQNGKNIGVYQAKIRADLREKTIEGEKRNYELKIQALEQTINHNNTRIQSLTAQLESALKQVQDLAVKAIEGTSNRNSFEAMKQIALEQAKAMPKNK